MKEHTHLVAEHDAPVALCIARQGDDIDWVEHLPAEVIYAPEGVFDICAPTFLEVVGDAYYGTTRLSAELLIALEADLRRAQASDDITVQAAAKDLLDFLDRGKSLSADHYMAFEGP
jgi:hypothetical protein